MKGFNGYEDETISIGDIIIDLTGRKVTKQGKVINLTPKEFSILTYLAKNKGKIISQEDIIENKKPPK